ncbi:MAG: hypothetical protein ACOVP1_07120 [Bacteroidia bacterium]
MEQNIFETYLSHATTTSLEINILTYSAVAASDKFFACPASK